MSDSLQPAVKQGPSRHPPQAASSVLPRGPALCSFLQQLEQKAEHRLGPRQLGTGMGATPVCAVLCLFANGCGSPVSINSSITNKLHLVGVH